MGYRLVKVYSNSSALVLFHVLMSTPVVKFSIINTGNFANITIGIIDAQHGHLLAQIQMDSDLRLEGVIGLSL
jgi:uncharacterized membrane protein YgaE (UPF0421/DUF939 family)